MRRGSWKEKRWHSAWNASFQRASRSGTEEDEAATVRDGVEVVRGRIKLGIKWPRKCGAQWRTAGLLGFEGIQKDGRMWGGEEPIFKVFLLGNG